MNVAKIAFALRMLADAIEEEHTSTPHELLVQAAMRLRSVKDAVALGRKIAAIKYLREYALDNGLDSSLMACKRAIDELCENPDMGYPGYRPQS